jgi:hypothetical protein
LLDEFSMLQPTDSDIVAVLDDLASGTAPWMGGETADEGLVRDGDPDERIRRVLGRLLLLEQAGDFCWNFRRGIPMGVVHLLRALLAQQGHALLPEPVETVVPVLASTRWSHTEELSELAGQYIGSDRVARVRDVPVDGIPALVDEFTELIETLLPSGSDPTDGAAKRAARSQAIAALTDVIVYPTVRAASYRERWQAAEMTFSDGRRSLVAEAADELGLVTATRPDRAQYAHAAVLGGGGRTPLLRAQYLDALIEEHGLRPGQVWMLGSPRLIEEDKERPAADTYAAGAVDEFDLMCAAAEQAFAALDPVTELTCGCRSDSDPCPTWTSHMIEHGVDADTVAATDVRLQHTRRRTYRVSRVGPINVLSASTSNPPDRPNTADTYALLAGESKPQPGDRALIVTTQVFYPFQSFDALRMLALPSGLMTETVGFGAEHSDRPNTAEFNLQEILSGVRSARRLVFALAAHRYSATTPAINPPAPRTVPNPLSTAQNEVLAAHARVLVGQSRRRDAIDLANWLAPRAEQSAVTFRRLFDSDGATSEVTDGLFALGWMLYEVSFPLANHHGAQEDTPDAQELRTVMKRLAECAESIEPKEYAARAGGAIRAYALALSKVDRTDYYDLALRQHEAADRWIGQLLQNAGSNESLRNEAWAVQVQLEAAKAGTSCRQIETYLCDPGKLDADTPVDTRHRQIAATARVGVTSGLAAIESFGRLPPAAGTSRRESLAEPIWPRQPANMAARAHLLLVPALAGTERSGMPYPTTLVQNLWETSKRTIGVSVEQPASYDEEIEFHRGQVVELIRIAEAAMVDSKGDALVPNDVAETARMRLHFLLQYPASALLAPASQIPYSHSNTTLATDAAIEHLSTWLESVGHDANVIGTVTLIPWVQGLIDVRRRQGVNDGYLAWRRAHPKLDRYLKNEERDGPDHPEIVRQRERLAGLFDNLDG